MPAKILIPPYSRKLKNPPYPEHVTEGLRERLHKGPVTLSADEVRQIIAMMEMYSNRCGEAYQVVGQIADFAGVHEDPAVIKAMDLLAFPLWRGEILPFYPEWLRAGGRAKPRRRKRAQKHLQFSQRTPEEIEAESTAKVVRKKRKSRS